MALDVASQLCQVRSLAEGIRYVAYQVYWESYPGDPRAYFLLQENRMKHASAKDL